jgi:hypothetical protein
LNSRYNTSLDPEFLATQSRPNERTREANARALATAGNKVSPQNLYQSGTVSIDPPNIGANTRASVSVTIENVAPGDFVIMNPPSALNAGLAYAGSIVAAADTVTVFIANITGGGINDGANVWEYMAVRLS